VPPGLTLAAAISSRASSFVFFLQGASVVARLAQDPAVVGLDQELLDQNLIEQVFEIPGMGRLSLEAIVGRDYPVFMGILSLTSVLGLVGNILSDFLYVLIDPRINFQEN